MASPSCPLLRQCPAFATGGRWTAAQDLSVLQVLPGSLTHGAASHHGGASLCGNERGGDLSGCLAHATSFSCTSACRRYGRRAHAGSPRYGHPAILDVSFCSLVSPLPSLMMSLWLETSTGTPRSPQPPACGARTMLTPSSKWPDVIPVAGAWPGNTACD